MSGGRATKGALAGFCLAIGALASCQSTGGGRGSQGSAAGDDPCDVDVNVLLECSDETCDLDAYDAELAACSVDDKADGIGDTLRGWMTRIQEKLAETAKGCFEAEDTGCLRKVYWALAAGAKVKGMPNAANMMWNFLGCDDDPAIVDPDAVQADDNVASVVAGLRSSVWAEAEMLAAGGAMDGTHEPDVDNQPVAADSADIWYAMGNFHIRTKAVITIESGAVASVKFDFAAVDYYDWHPGAAAGGSEGGVKAFKDDWAQFLVDKKQACEFDMISEWSETLTEAPQDAELPDELPDNRDGACCAPNGDKGCMIDACQMAVCAEDPYCCTNEWEGFCVSLAASFDACECDSGGGETGGGDGNGGSDDGGMTDEGGMTDGGGGSSMTSCVDQCGTSWVGECGCDPECVDFADCCSDYEMLCAG
ncbi:MAG: hypothetical protein AAF721_01240 [Myxococcota bacterium]